MNGLSKLAQHGSTSDLPYFNGNVEEWPLFITAFEKSREYHTNVENLNRLRKSLKGEAFRFVQALFISHDNVDAVMHILKMRFGRQE